MDPACPEVVIPTRDRWTLYSHHLSTSDSYQTSYGKLCDVRSYQDAGRMWNHTHPSLVGDPTRVIQIQGRRIISWSLFRDAISPEWEHPRNAGGLTFTLRNTMSPDVAYRLWEALVTRCVLSQHPPGLNGVQVSRKSTSVRPREPGLLMKFDVWFAPNTSKHDASQWVREILPGHSFAHVPRSQR